MNKFELQAKKSVDIFTIGKRVEYQVQGEIKQGVIIHSYLDDLNWMHSLAIIPDGGEFSDWIYDPLNNPYAIKLI